MADFHGMESLLAKFESLKREAKYKSGRAALRKAANFVAAKAKEGALRIDDPATPENIAKNIAVRWNGRRFKTTGDLAFRIGVMGGARQYGNTKENVRKQRVGQSYHMGGDKSNPGGDTWYWRMHELGTEKMSARPFMRPALFNNQNEIIKVFANAFERSVAAAIKKANKTG